MRLKTSQNRQTIVATANRLFYHQGYHQTSFSDIASAVGIPRGNFYYYFRSKDLILDAVIEQRIEEIRAMLTGWDAEFPDPKSRLKRFVQLLSNTSDEVRLYGCPMGTLNTELAKDSPDLAKQARLMFDVFRDWLVQQFTSISGKSSARQQAMHLMARMQGITVMTHTYADRSFMRAEAAQLDAWIDTL